MSVLDFKREANESISVGVFVLCQIKEPHFNWLVTSSDQRAVTEAEIIVLSYLEILS